MSRDKHQGPLPPIDAPQRQPLSEGTHPSPQQLYQHQEPARKPAFAPRPEVLTTKPRGAGATALLNMDELPKLRAAVRASVVNRLTVIDLAGARVGDDGVIELSLALAKNTAVTSLNLSRNGLSARGAAALRAVVSSNTTLRVLDVSHNPLDDRGALELAGVVRVNHGLQHLRMSACEVGEGGVTALSQASLLYNTTLTTLELDEGAALSLGDLRSGSERPAVPQYHAWEWHVGLAPAPRAHHPCVFMGDQELTITNAFFLAEALRSNANDLMTLECVGRDYSRSGIGVCQ